MTFAINETKQKKKLFELELNAKKMNPKVFFYSSSSDSDEKHHQMVIRSRIRDKSNPMALPEAAFRKRFRLTKDAFTFIVSEIEFNGHLSTAVSPILKLAATLSMQKHAVLLNEPLVH
ncbi:uncharacterized protein LOC120780957 [Bactrocera tryoni]|uniref:uncharacterized protein LOC120780957 n=1 Tax=Bactrocera tryoni TaxID=59916 RepID=UPI001A95DC58|nr:uncharacterized protein LOC120780957 [Bactrocera tryoni]